MRKFDGLTREQRAALIKIIDRNAILRKKVHLEPGICEKLDDQLYNQSQLELNVDQDSSKESLDSSIHVIDSSIHVTIHQTQSVADMSDYSDESDFYDQLEYPITELHLQGATETLDNEGGNYNWRGIMIDCKGVLNQLK